MFRYRATSRLLSSSAVRKEVFEIKDQADFEKRVLKAEKPVIVDFYADWCGPCKSLGPLITKVVESRQGKVDLAKVNVDELQDLSIDYGVAALPTVILIKKGQKAAQFLGLQSEDFLENFVPK